MRSVSLVEAYPPQGREERDRSQSRPNRLNEMGGEFEINLWFKIAAAATAIRCRRWNVVYATRESLNKLSHAERANSLILVQDAFAQYFKTLVLAAFIETGQPYVHSDVSGAQRR